MDRGMIGCFAQVTHPAKTLDQQVIKQRMDKVKCAHTCFRVHFNLSSSDIIAIICMSKKNDQKNYQSPLRAQVSHTLSLSKGKHLAQQTSSLGGGGKDRGGGAKTVSHV